MIRLLLISLSAGAALSACASTDAGPRIGSKTFAELDADANGSLSFEEYGEQAVNFTTLDRNGNGEVTAEEVRDYNRTTSAAKRRARNAETGSRL